MATFWTMSKCGLSIPSRQIEKIKFFLKGNNVMVLRLQLLRQFNALQYLVIVPKYFFLI